MMAEGLNQEDMEMKIAISVGPVTLDAELHDTPTSRKIIDALPIKGSISTWGDEIYFPIPVEEGLDSTAKEEVNMGDLGYWPSGKAFCIFFGPTPVSPPDKIVPASAVNIIGKVLDDATRFRGVLGEKEILIEPK
jgi:hypothetical protein